MQKVVVGGKVAVYYILRILQRSFTNQWLTCRPILWLIGHDWFRNLRL